MVTQIYFFLVTVIFRSSSSCQNGLKHNNEDVSRIPNIAPLAEVKKEGKWKFFLEFFWGDFEGFQSDFVNNFWHFKIILLGYYFLGGKCPDQALRSHKSHLLILTILDILHDLCCYEVTIHFTAMKSQIVAEGRIPAGHSCFLAVCYSSVMKRIKNPRRRRLMKLHEVSSSFLFACFYDKLCNPVVFIFRA